MRLTSVQPAALVTAGMAVYDTIQHIPNDVATTGLGFCASMGQFLLTAGAPGKRSVLPHTRMMLHLPALTPGADRTVSGNQPGEVRHHRQQMVRLPHIGHGRDPQAEDTPPPRVVRGPRACQVCRTVRPHQRGSRRSGMVAQAPGMTAVTAPGEGRRRAGPPTV
ncbi:ATP-dependent Clp protease proteolytic subunit [Streptomyces sp. NPDC000075]|uniref:ATP-dependent Clp protease proteolytic subunit n=1 Tax=Streptomyces TaxID=1883 RepID=UPI0033218C7E